MTRMMLIGEAWGKDELAEQRPFVGASGRILRGMLSQTGIAYSECYVTNVFNLKPEPTNDIRNLCGPKTEGIPWMPYLTKGKYVRAEFASELERLFSEIESFDPTLILALGATPTWALLRTSGIRKLRGTPVLSRQPKLRKQYKILPTYHPVAVMREWKLRPVVLADLWKAKNQATFPEIRRPERELWIEPAIDDLFEFERRFIDPAPDLSIDIETISTMITCIGFAPTLDRALVVPFFDETKPGKNYWPTLHEERTAWHWVRKQCAKEKQIVGQNFNYDMGFLLRQMGIPVYFAEDDTMLLHHALQPEMEKGLAFLGSIYTDESSWKLERKSSTIKRED